MIISFFMNEKSFPNALKNALKFTMIKLILRIFKKLLKNRKNFFFNIKNSEKLNLRFKTS